MRFIAELFDPSKRCARLGHKHKAQLKSALVKPELVPTTYQFNVRALGYNCIVAFNRCLRCSEIENFAVAHVIYPVTRVRSMPPEDFDLFEEKGYLVRP